MKIQPITPAMLRSNPDQFCFIINRLIEQVNALSERGTGGGSSS